jgi:aldose 1-epimerase
VHFFAATGEYVALLPEVGGTVHQLTLRSARDATQLHTLLNNEPIPEFIPSSLMFRGARLIPWPNRIPDGTFIFDGTSYRVPINDVPHNMSIHGLLYKRNMTVVSQSISPTQASVELSFDFGSAATRDSGYPFPVIINIVYALTAQGEFIATTTATLNGPPGSSAPFGDGWHPYFVLAAGSTNALFARVPATTEVQLDKAQLPLPGVPTQPFTRIPADGSLLRLYDLDVCLVVDAARIVTRRIGASDVRVAETVLSHPDTRLEVVVFQEAASYPYVQLFTQWNEVAIEPVTAPANAFNTGVGLIKLQPGVPWSGRMGVYIA